MALDPQVLGGDQPGDPPARHRRILVIWPATTSTVRVGQRAGPLELVTGDDDRRPRRRRLAEQGVELVAALGVEAGVRLVEQPQLGATGDEARQRGAAPLAGRQRADRDVGEPPGEPEPLDRRLDLVARGTDRRAPEPDVLGDGEIGVEAVGVPEQADPRADRVALAWPGRTRAPVPCRARSGADPAHSRSSVVLPAPFGPAQQHDLPGVDRQRRPGQRGEAAEHGDRVVELDHGAGFPSMGGENQPYPLDLTH